MVVFIINLDGIFTGPAECNPIVSGDANRPAAREAVQRMKPRSGEVDFFWFCRVVQHL